MELKLKFQKQIIPLEVPVTCTEAQLFGLVKERAGVEVASLKLLFKGKKLDESSEAILTSRGIKKGSKVSFLCFGCLKKLRKEKEKEVERKSESKERKTTKGEYTRRIYFRGDRPENIAKSRQVPQ